MTNPFGSNEIQLELIDGCLLECFSLCSTSSLLLQGILLQNDGSPSQLTDPALFIEQNSTSWMKHGLRHGLWHILHGRVFLIDTAVYLLNRCTRPFSRNTAGRSCASERYTATYTAVYKPVFCSSLVKMLQTAPNLLLMLPML